MQRTMDKKNTLISQIFPNTSSSTCSLMSLSLMSSVLVCSSKLVFKDTQHQAAVPWARVDVFRFPSTPVAAPGMQRSRGMPQAMMWKRGTNFRAALTLLSVMDMKKYTPRQAVHKKELIGKVVVIKLWKVHSWGDTTMFLSFSSKS